MQSWIPSDVFRKAGSKLDIPQAGGVFAVDIAKNWEHATIAYANQVGDEHHSELVQTFVNTNETQLFNRLVELYNKHAPRAIALDDRQLPGLGKRLKMAGIPTWQLWTKEVSAACSVVYALISTGKGKHNNDPLLIAQSPNGIARNISITSYAGASYEAPHEGVAASGIVYNANGILTRLLHYP